MLARPRMVMSPRTYSPWVVQKEATSLGSPLARALKNSWVRARTAAWSAARSGSSSPPRAGGRARPKSRAAPTAAHRVVILRVMGHLAKHGFSGHGRFDTSLTPCLVGGLSRRQGLLGRERPPCRLTDRRAFSDASPKRSCDPDGHHLFLLFLLHGCSARPPRSPGLADQQQDVGLLLLHGVAVGDDAARREPVTVPGPEQDADQRISREGRQEPPGQLA